MKTERLQKILARAGVASRRAAEQMILAGRVSVDGKVVRELGVKADPGAQRIAVDSKPLPGVEPKEYWMLHKPAGVVSTASDPQGRKSVLDLLPAEASGRLYPVGRLDRDSEGLLLLTNDGELAHRLTHPKYEVPKQYRVWVAGRMDGRVLQQLRDGVELEDGKSAPARVYVKSSGVRSTKLALQLREGKKREIRRMCQAVGHRVQRLVRVATGPVKLGDLPQGACRRLSMEEINGLRESVGLLSGCKPPTDGVKKASPNQPKSGSKAYRALKPADIRGKRKAKQPPKS